MKLKFRQVFSQASRGGNRRLFAIIGGVATLLGITLFVSSIHHKELPRSDPGRPPAANPLPGGLNSNPRQQALREDEIRDEAKHAQTSGQSYSPDIAPGTPTHPSHQPPQLAVAQEVGSGDEADPAMAKPAAPPAPHAPYVVPSVPVVPVQTDPGFRAAVPRDPQQQKDAFARYRRAIMDLSGRLNGRLPVTDVMYEQAEMTGTRKKEVAAAPAPSSAATANSQRTSPRVLVPAGRGIFAHTVSATNSDLGGEIILEADSGPLAGDRMKASVRRAGGHLNRLVVHVEQVFHKAEPKPIDVDGVVVAPDTMEAAVASSVDQLYLERFVLPAAAAFVQGLGQAIEMTSNTTGSIGALGNVNYVQSLNFPQQIGVAAGAAASQVNSALTQQMPTQPRVNLAAQVSVGVIFMSPVIGTK
ncbi:type IV secretion protein DotG [Komagataeibacter xylinus]|uniref:Type IV secretion protein DotG n=1 Tax=Komagataeibacter xylinus TaxID=28448 RepID=A0A318PMX4_KOMXY|nr:DotG/IcmE/VirB10 family protein [Komagataeibacter xylinus]PYD56396.1 type IV secretion protein DotG [Komagataeibacter xylinus]